jgi:hypothetical protein
MQHDAHMRPTATDLLHNACDDIYTASRSIDVGRPKFGGQKVAQMCEICGLATSCLKL